MNTVRQQHLTGTLARYVIVGVSVALVYLAAFAVLEHMQFARTAVNSAIAFILAIIFQYVAQGAFTFRRPLDNAGQVARFATTVGIGLLISSWIVGYFGPFFGLSNFASSLVVVVVLPFFNLIAFMLWVFVDNAKIKK